MDKPYQIVTGPESIQGSTEWLEFRKRHITASEIPVILELSPYQTPLQLAEEKLNETIDLNKESRKRALFEFAFATEIAARDALSKHLQLKLEPTVATSNEVPILMCSLDGYNPLANIILEVKHVSKEYFNKVKTISDIYDYHMAQIQSQLFIMKAKKCYYFIAEKTGDSKVMEITSDDSFKERTLPRVIEFHELISQRKYPEPSDKDFITIEDTKLLQLLQLKTLIDRSQKQFDILKNEIDFEYKTLQRFKGHGIKCVRSIRKGSIPYSKLDEVRKLDLEKYRSKDTEILTIRTDKE